MPPIKAIAMKILHIEAKSGAKINISPKQLKALPKKLGILTTIQHLHLIKDVQKQVPGSIIGGQVLGCDVSAAKKIAGRVDAFLYIGSGEFHPIGIAVETGKTVHCFNPFTKEMKEIGINEIDSYEKRRHGAMLKFLNSQKIGILVSTKQGQCRMKDAVRLSEKKDREYFIFAFDTLNEHDLENFPFIECWVNTACPRIAYQTRSMVNIDDLPK